MKKFAMLLVAVLLVWSVGSVASENISEPAKHDREITISMLRESKIIPLIQDAAVVSTDAIVAEYMEYDSDAPDYSVMYHALEVSKESTMILIFSKEFESRMFQQFAEMYEEVFTPEEIAAIHAWSTSPTGRKAASTLPELMQQGAVMGLELQDELRTHIELKYNEIMEVATNE